MPSRSTSSRPDSQDQLFLIVTPDYKTAKSKNPLDPRIDRKVYMMKLADQIAEALDVSNTRISMKDEQSFIVYGNKDGAKANRVNRAAYGKLVKALENQGVAISLIEAEDMLTACKLYKQRQSETGVIR
jgi:predicted Zn-dependent protease